MKRHGSRKTIKKEMHDQVNEIIKPDDKIEFSEDNGEVDLFSSKVRFFTKILLGNMENEFLIGL